VEWAEHVDRKGKKEIHTEFWWGSSQESDHFENKEEYMRVILRSILAVIAQSV
jgi:hypothetical protein